MRLLCWQRKTIKYKTKNTKQQRKGGEKNKAITLQLGGANCSFNDKVLDDESDENGDDGENHEEEESALLVCQASSGSVGLGAGPGPGAGRAAAHRHFISLRWEGHCGAVGAAQLGGVLALPDSTHPETVVAAGLQVLDVEGCGGAFVSLWTEGKKCGQKTDINVSLQNPWPGDTR